MTESLTSRQPALPWIVTAITAALGVHGVVWFLFQSLSGGQSPGLSALGQMGLALGWMVPIVCLWLIYPPKRRRIALGMCLACVAFIGTLGSLTAYLREILSHNIPSGIEFFSSFSAISLGLVLGQIFLALPSSLVLQYIYFQPRPRLR